MNEAVLFADPVSIEAPVPAAPDDWRDHARSLIGDLFQRSPGIYWADFLLSVAAAWAAAAVCFTAAPWSPAQLAAFLVAGVLFFRAGTFILYRNHIEHHGSRTYGTPQDGEYLPLAASPLAETLKYLVQAPLLPAFMIVRFGLLGPLSWLHPGLREWVLTRASAAVSNPHYRKRFPRRDEAHLKVAEAICLAWLGAIGLLTWQGTIRLQHLLPAYVLLACTLGLNWVRNLAAHRYANGGARMSHGDQVADSINITGQTWLTMFLFPVGLRYHALHHLFPALPYHQMGAAHRRLMRNLPPDSPYRATNRSSYFAVVGELWQSARRTARGQSAMRRWAPGSARP